MIHHVPNVSHSTFIDSAVKTTSQLYNDEKIHHFRRFGIPHFVPKPFSTNLKIKLIFKTSILERFLFNLLKKTSGNF